MGIPILIMGKSGSGKSTSLRNFNKDEILLINVGKKPLPFKGKFTDTLNSDNYDEIAKTFMALNKKTIVIDDAGYLITNMFMRGHSTKGAGSAIFSFYNDLADRFWRMIEHFKALPDDVNVYIMMHEESNDLGEIKPKTIGKMLDEKVCLEGLFTIVLRCIIQDGKHYFVTQSEGNDVSKSPIGMFDERLIDNDLKNVDNIIRDFYKEEEL